MGFRDSSVCTNKGRVVYNRKRHSFNGYALLRIAFSFSGISWSGDPEAFLFLSVAAFYLLDILQLHSNGLGRIAGTLIYLDQVRDQVILRARKSGKKIPKKWKIYESIREDVLKRWTKKTLKDAWDAFILSVDLIDNFTPLFNRVRSVLEYLF